MKRKTKQIDNDSIYVTGLTDSVTETALAAHFGMIGRIKVCIISLTWLPTFFIFLKKKKNQILD